MANFYLSLAFVAMLLMSHGVSGKRGCSAFGHSCYGGHGKRSMDPPGMDMMNRRAVGQEETGPLPGYPNAADEIIPIRDGGIFERDARELMKLRNIVKRWMESYRQNQDGFNTENL